MPRSFGPALLLGRGGTGSVPGYILPVLCVLLYFL